MMQGNRRTLRMLAVLLVAASMIGCAGEESESKLKWRKSSALPADFPKDVAIYPEATLKDVLTAEGVPTENGAFITWSTKDDIPKVRHYFNEKFDAEGWHVISYPGVAAGWMGEGGVTVVATKWGRTASYGIGAKDGATLITLVLPQK